MIRIGQRIPIYIERTEHNFDRACEEAYKCAMRKFGCQDGHLTNVQDSDRSRDSVVMEFVGVRHSGSMGGQSIVYEFVAWVESEPEEEDD